MSIRKMDEEKLRTWIGGRKAGAIEERACLGANDAVVWLDGYLRAACDAAIPKRPTVTQWRPCVFNACLWEGFFPGSWKVARLALVYKEGGKPLASPSSYRPLCMINSAAKLMERLVLSRLSRAVAANGGLSDSQYGFRPGRSTIQAINEVLNMADAAASGPTQDRDLCLLVTLDVRNAFNSVPWAAIDGGFERRELRHIWSRC